MEKKPNKKEELTLVNNVLKLATKLLKVSAELGWVRIALLAVNLVSGDLPWLWMSA